MSKVIKSDKTQAKNKINPRVTPQTDMLLDLVKEMLREDEATIDLDGTEDVGAFQEYSVDEDEMSMLVSEDDIVASKILQKSSNMRA